MSFDSCEPKVLVTGAGGPAGVSVIRSLAAKARLFAVDIDPCAAGLYLVDEQQRALVPRGDDSYFVDRIFDLCLKWDIDVVIPTVDVELLPLALAESRFVGRNVRILGGPSGALATCLDKWQLALAVDSTVRCPATHLIDQRFDPLGFPSWPAVVKPRSGSGSRGVRTLEHPDQLLGVARDGSMILQQYLPGEELSVDVLIDRSGVTVGAVPRIRCKVDSGVSVAGRTVRDGEATSLAVATLRAVGLTGPANVQCRRDSQGRLALLEVNPRFPGSLPLTEAAGFNIVELAVREALGMAVEPLGTYAEIGVVRHLEEVIVGADFLARTTMATQERVGVTL